MNLYDMFKNKLIHTHIVSKLNVSLTTLTANSNQLAWGPIQKSNINAFFHPNFPENSKTEEMMSKAAEMRKDRNKPLNKKKKRGKAGMGL